MAINPLLFTTITETQPVDFISGGAPFEIAGHREPPETLTAKINEV
jgi:hypothetical protein